MAIHEKVNNFIVWFPALAYYDIDTPLYQLRIPNENISGLILAGTEDKCSRCNPDFDKQFVEINPQVSIHFLIGAEHTDSRYFMECVDQTMIFIETEWHIPKPTSLINYYLQGYIGIGLILITVLIDLVIFLKRKIEFRKYTNGKKEQIGSDTI